MGSIFYRFLRIRLPLIAKFPAIVPTFSRDIEITSLVESRGKVPWSKSSPMGQFSVGVHLLLLYQSKMKYDNTVNKGLGQSTKYLKIEQEAFFSWDLYPIIFSGSNCPLLQSFMLLYIKQRYHNIAA